MAGQKSFLLWWRAVHIVLPFGLKNHTQVKELKRTAHLKKTTEHWHRASGVFGPPPPPPPPIPIPKLALNALCLPLPQDSASWVEVSGGEATLETPPRKGAELEPREGATHRASRPANRGLGKLAIGQGAKVFSSPVGPGSGCHLPRGDGGLFSLAGFVCSTPKCSPIKNLLPFSPSQVAKSPAAAANRLTTNQ